MLPLWLKIFFWEARWISIVAKTKRVATLCLWKSIRIYTLDKINIFLRFRIISLNTQPHLQTQFEQLCTLDERGSIVVRVYAPMRKVYGSSPTRCPDWTLAHCLPSSIWVPGGNTGEIRRRGKELTTLSHMPMAQVKCPLYYALPYVRKYTGLPLLTYVLLGLLSA